MVGFFALLRMTDCARYDRYLLGMAGCVAIFPFVTRRNDKGLTAHGGILRFAQNDKYLLGMAGYARNDRLRSEWRTASMTDGLLGMADALL